MEWKNLEKKGEAPGQGWLLAYTREQVLFHLYGTIEAVEQELAGTELLELHLFNQEKEYRCLSTRSKRFPKGMIETVENFDEMGNTVYAERIRISESRGGGMITVLNQISHNKENGMAFIDNYRLKM